MFSGSERVDTEPGDGELVDEPPMRRTTAILVVAFVALLPIAVVVAIVVAATRDEPARTTAVLDIGSCVEIAGGNGDITDVECPDGNGRVMAVRQSSAECPAATRWAIVRDAQIFCIERTRRDSDPPDSVPSARTPITVSCEPVPRFRLDGIDYVNIRFSDVVAEADLGDLVGAIEVHPTAFDRCESFIELRDGEGSWPVGTLIFAIDGIDPTISLAAALPGGVYLRFDATGPPNS